MADIGQRILGVGGLVILVGIAWLLSSNRRHVPWRSVLWGVGLQFAFGLVILAPNAAMAAAGISLLVLLVVAGVLLAARRPSPWRTALWSAVVLLVLLVIAGPWGTAGIWEHFALAGPGAGRAVAHVAALGILAVIAAGFLPAWRRDPRWGVTWSLCALTVAAISATGWGVQFLGWFRGAFATVIGFTDEGTRFMLGDWGAPVTVTNAATGEPHKVGVVLAFRMLPVIIFFASLMSVLYHLGVMRRIVGGMAWVMRRTMRVSGAEALSASGNIFVGMTEAPLMIRPYVASMTESELFTIMVGGLATVAGSVMAFYVSFGIDAAHLLCASVMSAPASLAIAKILFPEMGEPVTSGSVPVEFRRQTRNVIDAAATGAWDGLRLAANVAAMLIAFVALLAMANFLIGALHDGAASIGWRGWPRNIEDILGWLFRPLAWAVGVPWGESRAVGSIMGIGISANECIAYMKLVEIKGTLSPRSVTITTYALCNFANFGSLGIIIGGLGGLAPERRQDLSRLALRALAGGALASYMTATIAGMLV